MVESALGIGSSVTISVAVRISRHYVLGQIQTVLVARCNRQLVDDTFEMSGDLKGFLVKL